MNNQTKLEFWPEDNCAAKREVGEPPIWVARITHIYADVRNFCIRVALSSTEQQLVGRQEVVKVVVGFKLR